MIVKGKTFLVLGMGQSGKETYKWLKSQEAEVFAWDDKSSDTEFLSNLEQVPWDHLEGIIQSPGIPFQFPKAHPVTEIAQQKKIPIFTDINLLQASQVSSKYIGITGTNGKSTTTALINHILKETDHVCAMGGNIGVPALALPEMGEKGTHILELSSFQLEISQPLNLDMAVWLNITPDHLDRHNTMDLYVQAKSNIFKKAKKAVICIDDDYSYQIAEKVKNDLNIPVLTVSAIQKVDIFISQGYLIDKNQRILQFDKASSLKGMHNYKNIAVAYAVAKLYEIDIKLILQAIKTFPGLSHRLEVVAEKDNIIFVNDSKATNAEAVVRAFESYEDYQILWIAGGKPKSDGIEPLISYFSQIAHTFLIGQAQEEFKDFLQNKAPYSLCQTLDYALQEAWKMAQQFSKEQSVVILLSPACASYDQFSNFEHRGDVFRKLVKEII